MVKNELREFPVDNASILFLSLIRPYHTNNFRFSAVLRHPVCPEILQQAVDRIHPRFPSVIAGFRQDFLHYRQVAAVNPPRVQPDPGLLLPMTGEELRNCAFRVYYHDCTIAIELFHALTDGCGAIATLTALVGEYLRITQYNEVPEADLGCVLTHEVADSYLELSDAKTRRLPTRFSYLLPRPADADWQVRGSSLTLKTEALLEAAHRHEVTLNTLLTTVLASTVMDMQAAEKGRKRLQPVRIMVPVNLRKIIGSRTLRNFSLYALPTLEGHQRALSFREKCRIIHEQLKEQLSQEFQSGVAANNVRSQNLLLFRMLPWKLKKAALRFGYRFCGESNSSLTLTNLGVVRMPQELAPHVVDFQCWMTPRVSSPYGCTILSFGDRITLNMSRFCPTDQLGEKFFRNLREMIE